jgi:UDP:flavonoid glycosyltransferase YjiC (YdhE family)
MANIVFCMLPEKGHVNASLKIAKSLKSRGHRVYYLQILEFEEYIRSQGLEFIPLFEKSIPKGCRFSHNMQTIENIRARLKAEADTHGVSITEFVKGEYKNIRDMLERIDAHLLVHDTFSPVSHDKLESEIPYVLLNTIINVPSGAGATSTSGVPTLILCPEEFDLPHPQSAAHVHYVEASIDIHRKEPQFPWNQVREDKRLIYCSLGTQSHWSYPNTSNESNQRIRKNFLQTVINTMVDKPEWQLILSIGDYRHALDFHSVPSNVLLFNSVPQIEILERASLMITTGGLNSIKECIFFGVPMIVFPSVGDQHKNAECVVYHKLGLKGDMENVSEGLIHSLIDEATSNPIYRPKIEKMKRIFRRAESGGQAVTFIESALVR